MAVSLHLVALVCPCLLLWRVTDGLGPRLTVFTDLHVDDVVVNSFLFDDAASSLTGCARQCSRHAGCLTFTFTEGLPGQGQCRGYSTKVTTPGVTALAGAKSFWQGPWLGKSCTTNSDCVGNMTACFSGQCQCDGGYFFSHLQHACVKACAAFHPTIYAVYSEYAFNQHDISFEFAAPSAQYCQERCSATPGCLMAYLVLQWSVNHCYYKDATAQDFPADWAKSAPGCGCGTYQRTCL